ncbi:MAG: hypothetical protein ACK481_02890 [Candidatus Melainabacteria bacterium]|jgi:hypothetical protein
MGIVSSNDLIWIISLFCSCIITIYLAFVSKTKKKKIIFTLLAIISTFFSVVFILVLIPHNRCRDMANHLPKSLEEALISNKSIPLNFGSDDSGNTEFNLIDSLREGVIYRDRCWFKLIDALKEGAISHKDEKLRKKYVCVLYNEANYAHSMEGEFRKEFILTKVFYKNPIHSIQCLNINKGCFTILTEGLFFSLTQDKKMFISLYNEKFDMNEDMFNTLCDNLMVSKELNNRDKEKVKLLRHKVLEYKPIEFEELIQQYEDLPKYL